MRVSSSKIKRRSGGPERKGRKIDFARARSLWYAATTMTTYLKISKQWQNFSIEITKLPLIIHFFFFLLYLDMCIIKIKYLIKFRVIEGEWQRTVVKVSLLIRYMLTSAFAFLLCDISYVIWVFLLLYDSHVTSEERLFFF